MFRRLCVTLRHHDYPRSARLPARLLALVPALLLAACGTDDASADAQRRAQAAQGVEPATVADAIARLPEFSQFRGMVQRAGVAPILADPAQRLTVIVPRDTAFARLAPEARTAVLSGSSAAVLRGFIIPRTLSADELRTRIIAGGGTFAIASLAGTPLTFSLSGDQLIVTSASGQRGTLGTAGLTSGNGTLYVLDRWVGPGG